MSTSIHALYVHVPFCHTICGYCDFYSVVLDKRDSGPLVDAVLTELDAIQREHSAVFKTIFVGGGTPTTLPIAELRRLMSALADHTAPGCEFTVEANPATVTQEVAETLVQNGVNRVSIGAQSFDHAELRVLDRIHEPEHVPRTVEICRAAGIERLNLDLIFGIPGQTLEAWLHNLRMALQLDPGHMSCYGLTYEPGTPLYDRLQAGRIERIDNDVEAEMFEGTIETLAAADYAQYEISNFARHGQECRHNLTYWRNEAYLGIGPSGAGFVDGVRYKNVPDVAAYVAAMRDGRSPRIEEENRSLSQQAQEVMMLSLRLNDGVARDAFASRFGNDPVEMFAEPVARHRAAGLLECADGRLKLTDAGRLLADSVIADFL